MKRFFPWHWTPILGLTLLLSSCGGIDSHDTHHALVSPSQVYVDILNNSSPSEALASLTEDLETDLALTNQCHMIVHHLGHAAFERYGFSEAMTYADDLCGSGYMHGVTELYISEMEDPLSALSTVCPKDYGACFHGVGHGLFMFYHSDLEASLAGCSSFAYVQEQVQCSEGVFMENFYTDLNIHSNPNLNPADPLGVCSEQSTLYKSACYFYGPRYYLTLHPRNYLEALDLCSTVEVNYTTQCARGLGSALMRQNLDELSLTFDTCSAAPADLQKSCYSGLASYYMIHKGSYEEAIPLCEQVPSEFTQTCSQTIEASRNFFLD